MTMRVWVNGVLLESPDVPAITVTDHGFTVGDGVFESLKAVHGEPFALTRHLSRLTRSARGLGLPDPSLDAVREGVAAVLEAAEWPLGRVRITYTPGVAPMGSGRGAGPVTLAITAAPAQPWPETTAAITVEWPRNERGPLAGLKTTSYADNVIALARATERGASEAIFGNLAGNVCEGTGTNVFYVIDGEVRTPTLASGCLAGVTRELLLEWYDVREVDEPMEVLLRADEIFLTSSTRDVQGVHQLDERELEAPGPMTRAAHAAWVQHEALTLDP